MANESDHMKSQAGMRLRSAIGVAGRAIKGSHPSQVACLIGLAAIDLESVLNSTSFLELNLAREWRGNNARS
jgi:hypothetical protein